jgi:urea transporter
MKSDTINLLRGVGQIMFQPSALTGLFFLMGILINSTVMFVGALLALVTSGVFSRLAKLNNHDTEQGLFGFNAALVGIGVLFFYEFSLTSIVLVIIGSILSCLLMKMMLQYIKAFPPLTAPFVISMWLILVTGSFLSLPLNNLAVSLVEMDYFSIFRGVGQVMFQDYWLTGLLFLIGVALHNIKAASWLTLGSILGALSTNLMGFPEDSISLGLFGFNASLVAVAVSSRYSGFIKPVIGIMISVLIMRLFQVYNLPALTAPFILSTWIILSFKFSCLYRLQKLVELKNK